MYPRIKYTIQKHFYNQPSNAMFKLTFGMVALCLSCITIQAQVQYPTAVETALQKAGKNRTELEKAIQYFIKKGDSLQLKSAYFLIENMPIHSSHNYYWADSLGKKIQFNELNYPDFTSALEGFEEIKKTIGKLHPVPTIYKDIDTIKANYLIENIESATTDWKNLKPNNINFQDFCEYLLPYRVSIEPIENWRAVYKKHFSNLKDSIKNYPINTQLDLIEQYINSFFNNTYNKEVRNEPLPRLSALQLLHRQKGACEDGADLVVLAMRALGIPASVDFVPYWATTMSSHFLYGTPNKLISKSSKVDSPMLKNRLNREPGKVFRSTFSNQKNTLAAKYPKEQIPPGFMRSENYIDVTNSYWNTQDLAVKLFNNPSIVYAAVFNYATWRPVWWASVQNQEAIFTNMSKGAVYLPMQYDHFLLQPIGYPVALGYQHQQVLKPDTLNTHTIHLNAQDKYLQFHPLKKYTLYYWNNKWKKLASELADETTTQMTFQNIPRNALLILIPEDSKYKERPFIITEKGERVWF